MLFAILEILEFPGNVATPSYLENWQLILVKKILNKVLDRKEFTDLGMGLAALLKEVMNR